MACLPVALIACRVLATRGPARLRPDVRDAGAAAGAAALAFRSAVDSPPPGWTGPVFALSHDYPTADAELRRALAQAQASISTTPAPKWPGANNEWSGYVQDIVDYVKYGQDPDLRDEIGWRSEVDGSTRWFHVPWMAFDGERGREFVHGLTNELSTARVHVQRRRARHRPARPASGATAPERRRPALRNLVGRLLQSRAARRRSAQGWPASGEPATYKDEKGRLLAQRACRFPEGTVVVKLLNTTADETAVPYLKGSTSWQANAHKQTGPTTYSTCERAVRRVHLVQIDLAVVDLRSPTRWVYSTLGYDGTHPGQDGLGSHAAARRAVGQRSRQLPGRAARRRASRCARRC